MSCPNSIGSFVILLFENLKTFNDVKYWIDAGIAVKELFDIVKTSNFENSLIKEGIKLIELLSNFKVVKFLNSLKFLEILEI